MAFEQKQIRTRIEIIFYKDECRMILIVKLLVYKEWVQNDSNCRAASL